jgi:3-hydroxyisobutyrate dehydrogenase-like beta-hydroxyacid dehydrogenase
VLVSLPTPDVVEEVAMGSDGLVAGDALRVYVDMSTSGPQTARVVATKLTEAGIAVLDAPVSGGISGAETGDLSIMVAGDRGVFEANQVLLEGLGRRIFYVGHVPGQAQTIKVINNLIEAATLAITSEGMVLGAKAGLNSAVMLEILNVSSGRNSATAELFPRSIITRKFNEGFAMKLAYKDVKLCNALGRDLGVPMWVGSCVEQLFACAASDDDGEHDFTRVAELYERWAGIVLGVDAGAT